MNFKEANSEETKAWWEKERDNTCLFAGFRPQERRTVCLPIAVPFNFCKASSASFLPYKLYRFVTEHLLSNKISNNLKNQNPQATCLRIAQSHTLSQLVFLQKLFHHTVQKAVWDLHHWHWGQALQQKSMMILISQRDSKIRKWVREKNRVVNKLWYL